MGTALRKLKKSGIEDENGQLVKLKGRLTDDAITALNVYYGGAIRNNKDGIWDGTSYRCLIFTFHVYRRTPDAYGMS